MKKNIYLLLAATLMLIVISSCHKEDPPIDVPETGNLVIKFAHYVDGNPLQKDTMIYTNAAGNQYEINELKYFISDLQLHKSGGTVINIDDCKWAYYVDNDITSTLTWNICDKIPEGTYDSISFRFGILSSKNISYMFVNPPEVDMQWPDVLGGGYHDMQMNGKWKDSIQQIENFNTHLGIGRVISGSDTTFVDNSFHVTLASSAFTMTKDATKEIQLIMNIDSWFKTPFIYDHNHYGQSIMQNQNAMHIISANGFDVFTVGYIH
jgi:hypothetical protein